VHNNVRASAAVVLSELDTFLSLQFGRGALIYFSLLLLPGDLDFLVYYERMTLVPLPRIGPFSFCDQVSLQCVLIPSESLFCLYFDSEGCWNFVLFLVLPPFQLLVVPCPDRFWVLRSPSPLGPSAPICVLFLMGCWQTCPAGIR